MENVYDFEIRSLTGDLIKTSKYLGKILLIVNVASKCEFTPQYKLLQEMYDKYKAKGLEILGVPCDQFWNQEPGSPTEILEFCESNYSITFPLTEKVKVKGDGICPLYDFLTSSDSAMPGEISWNFEKFLIDRAGNIVSRFSPEMSPDDAQIQERIESYLAR